MNPLYFKELDGYFDPNRARLTLRCGRLVSIVAGVETGQLVGELRTLEILGLLGLMATALGMRMVECLNWDFVQINSAPSPRRVKVMLISGPLMPAGALQSL